MQLGLLIRIVLQLAHILQICISLLLHWYLLACLQRLLVNYLELIILTANQSRFRLLIRINCVVDVDLCVILSPELLLLELGVHLGLLGAVYESVARHNVLNLVI